MRQTIEKWLHRPHPYLAMIFLLIIACIADSFRPPQRQWTATIYIGLVRNYQVFGRPITRKTTTCPYHPTCSRYSLEAVERHGIRRGLMLTWDRLWRCRTDVELGTPDPVPKT